MRYVYRAHTLQGEPTSGYIESSTAANAKRTLASRGLIVAYLEEMQEVAAIATPPAASWFREINLKAFYLVAILILLSGLGLARYFYLRSVLPAPLELVLDGRVTTIGTSPSNSTTPQNRPRIRMTVCFPKGQLYLYSNGTSALRSEDGILYTRSDPQAHYRMIYRSKDRYRLIIRFTPTPGLETDTCTLRILSKGMRTVKFSPIRLRMDGDKLRGLVPKVRLISSRARRPAFSENL